MASLRDIIDTLSTFRINETGLDILVCNAGVIEKEYKLTEDGIEMDFQVNYLGMENLFPAILFRFRELGSECRSFFVGEGVSGINGDEQGSENRVSWVRSSSEIFRQRYAFYISGEYQCPTILFSTIW